MAQLAYENPDGTALTVDTDYFDKPRNISNLAPGPFADVGDGEIERQLWPKK